MNKEWMRFLATRIINDVRKPERINPSEFEALCFLYFVKEINNIQFKSVLKELEK